MCLGFVCGGSILVMKGFSSWAILVVEGVFGFEWAAEMGSTANLVGRCWVLCRLICGLAMTMMMIMVV